MFLISDKQNLAKDIIKITIDAPQISKKAKPGQFVVLLIDDKSERIPLTLADWDEQRQTITLIFQQIGQTTKKLGSLNVQDKIQHILGPLGHPTEVGNLGEVACVAGGVGVAEIYPVSRAFKQAGNQIIGIIGARSKDLLILENEMKGICQELLITTDDGSYGQKGFVTDILKELLSVIEQSTHTKYPNLVYCIGPVMMMKAVSELTRSYKIKTVVSLNPIMVDATGMCGACRCSVAGETVFGCVDGPEFDGHKVDFNELAKRINLFKEQEEKVK